LPGASATARQAAWAKRLLFPTTNVEKVKLGLRRATLLPWRWASTLSARSVEVAGVQLADKAQVESRDLVLNGAGLRKRVFFNVYVIGLYLPEKKSDANSIMALGGPKRAAIHMLRDVGAEQFSEALVDGMRANHTEAEFKALEPRVKELTDTMNEVKEAKKGMTIALDWTGAATRVRLSRPSLVMLANAFNPRTFSMISSASVATPAMR